MVLPFTDYVQLREMPEEKGYAKFPVGSKGQTIPLAISNISNQLAREIFFSYVYLFILRETESEREREREGENIRQVLCYQHRAGSRAQSHARQDHALSWMLTQLGSPGSPRDIFEPVDFSECLM